VKGVTLENVLPGDGFGALAYRPRILDTGVKGAEKSCRTDA